MDNEIFEIDGSLLEGGGQILRIALTMSVLCKKAVRISNIRAGRSKPGLMDQHLAGLQLAAKISHATVTGDSIGSQVVEFHPQALFGGQYSANIRTAGSIGLLLQVVLPCALFANTKSVFTLTGGTNAEMAPQLDYTTEVFRINLEKFGSTFEFDLIKRGYFPKGGGKVVITTNPVDSYLKPIDMVEFGHIERIFGWSFVAGKLPIRISHDMASAAINQLKPLQAFVDIEEYQENWEIAPDNCSGIIIVAETSSGCILGASALGRKNETAHETGTRAANELLKDINAKACVDQHCQDQLIVFMALANGLSRIKVSEITMHTKTAIYIVEQLTSAKFNVETHDEYSIIKCTGIGLKV